MRVYVENKKFGKVNFTEELPEVGEYENCSFLHCDFSNIDLSEFKFMDCDFTGCNLSLVKLGKTVFRDIRFKDCKLLGLNFANCSGFTISFSFDNCILNHSSFYGVTVKRTVFRNSQLQEVDFTGCNLTDSVFDQCDLTRSIFDNTNLEKVDFRAAYHYTIDAERNRIKKAKFALPEVIGLLSKYDIDIDNV